MGYYLVRSTDSETREFVVRADSKLEAMQLVTEAGQTGAKKNDAIIRQTNDSAHGSMDACEVEASVWTTALKSRKK